MSAKSMTKGPFGALAAFPGVLLELGPDGSVEASNGRLENALGGAVVGRSFPTLLEEASRKKWAALTEGSADGCSFGELFFRDQMHRSFLILKVGEPGNGRLRLVECGSGTESQRLISELTALNTELVSAHRELAKKKVELEVARSAAAGEARDREELMRVVSHDLRAPLNVVVLKAALLDQPSLPESRRQEHLQGIRQAVDHAERLIRDLSDAASMQAGRFRIERQPVDLCSLLAKAQQVLLPLATERDVQIEADLGGPVPPISGDPRRLLQVFENLLGNAIKFTDQGDTIELRAWAEARRVVACVSDHGPGILKQHRERIFDPYWTSAPAGGRGSPGLGLSIARGIVEAHGGDIWVETEIGRGTTFFVSLGLDDERGDGAGEGDGEGE